MMNKLTKYRIRGMFEILGVLAIVGLLVVAYYVPWPWCLIPGAPAMVALILGAMAGI